MNKSPFIKEPFCWIQFLHLKLFYQYHFSLNYLSPSISKSGGNNTCENYCKVSFPSLSMSLLSNKIRIYFSEQARPKICLRFSIVTWPFPSVSKNLNSSCKRPMHVFGRTLFFIYSTSPSDPSFSSLPKFLLYSSLQRLMVLICYEVKLGYNLVTKSKN